MALAEVVVNAEAGHHRGEPSAWLVHAEELGHRVAQRRRAVVFAAECDRRHRDAQHAGGDRMALGVVAVEEAVRRRPLDHLRQLPARFTASWTPMLRPCPPSGACTCAASCPTSTRPSR